MHKINLKSYLIEYSSKNISIVNYIYYYIIHIIIKTEYRKQKYQQYFQN